MRRGASADRNRVRKRIRETETQPLFPISELRCLRVSPELRQRSLASLLFPRLNVMPTRIQGSCLSSH